MIEVRHLSKHFGKVRAVDDISFTVKKGERFVLLGTSGCGKTTTLKMINRLIEPDSGEIFINGEPYDQQSPELLRRSMGYVLQDTGLFPHYTIAENISVVPDLLKWDKGKIKRRAEQLLEKFQMPPQRYLTLYPDQLSGGQRQRIGFARALMADPPILLMDEPLGALDPITRNQMQKEFKRLNELKDKTTIMVTHDIPEAIELGDRICLMDNGKIQQTGSAVELLLHPKNDFVKHFFTHDQFLLQLKALHINDLLPYLSADTDQHDQYDLNAGAPLLEAVEQLSSLKSTSEKITILNENKNQYYKLSMAELFIAFQEKLNSA